MRHAAGEELELDEATLAMEAPHGPGKGGVWMEGPLRKRPPEKRGVSRGLQRRLCVLKADGLYYYGETAIAASEAAAGTNVGLSPEDAKGKIPLVAIRTVGLSRTAEGAQIEIDAGTRNFLFVAADEPSAHGWRLAIEAARDYRGAAAAKRMRERQASRAQRSDLAAQVVERSKLSGSRLSVGSDRRDRCVYGMLEHAPHACIHTCASS